MFTISDKEQHTDPARTFWMTTRFAIGSLIREVRLGNGKRNRIAILHVPAILDSLCTHVHARRPANEGESSCARSSAASTNFGSARWISNASLATECTHAPSTKPHPSVLGTGNDQTLKSLDIRPLRPPNSAYEGYMNVGGGSAPLAGGPSSSRTITYSKEGLQGT